MSLKCAPNIKLVRVRTDNRRKYEYRDGVYGVQVALAHLASRFDVGMLVTNLWFC